jgi:TMEM175 potassium channel family protein
MTRGRLEAFSDGVIAILITIMVLELKIPKEKLDSATLSALAELMPIFLTYVLSFIMLGIYWNNHHHMFHAVDHVGGGILWANLHLLFWLSLVPFTTGWMGENHAEALPTATYGAVLLAAAIAYTILVMAIIRHQGKGSKLKELIGKDRKGKISIALYAAAIPLAFVSPWIAITLYVMVALIWLVPDTRIEKKLGH